MSACNYDSQATADDGSCSYPTVYYMDADFDGFGSNDMWGMTNTFCTDPGLGWSLNNLDCNDNNDLIFPGATELCNGLDDDCSGTADNGLTFNEYFADADGDSFGVPALNYVVTPITYQLLTPQVLPSNVTLDLAGRIMSYTGISINGATNTEVVAAGSTVSLTYNLAVTWGPNLYCPGCVTQSYIGIGGSTTTLQCENGIYDGYNTSYNSGTFTAPTTPGTYYLVQNGSLDYFCQPQTYANTPANAIAILQVEGTLPTFTNAGPNCDDCTAQVPIGFTFPFYGNTYSSLAISSNGFVSFDLGVPNGCCFGNILPGADAVNNMIALGWYDLLPNNGQITYFNLTNPNRLVIQYSNAPEYSGSGSLTGQIVMFESGLIQLIYSNLTTATHEATAGVENASGTVGVTLSGLNAQIGSLFNVAYEFVYSSSILVPGVSSCTPLVGYALNNTDCLDNNPALNPGATELCNGIDDNCSGVADDGLTFTDYYADLDLDGYGAGAATNACAQPIGFVTTNTDCDDNNASANPAATEICNTIDDNCDGQIDEGVQNTYYVDMDGDGYGSMNFWSIQACTAPLGFALSSNDCADNNPAINPGATEVCNTIDENCDGQINEGFGPLTIYYADADGDGYGNGTQAISVLLQGSSSASVSNGSLVIVGSNTFTGSSLTGSVSFVAPVDATYIFDWSYSTNDVGPNYDPAYYINGTAYPLSDDFGPQTQSGTLSVTVTAGSTFGFSVLTTDDVAGSATLTISNFNGFTLPTFTQACSQPAGYALVNGDCNDSDASVNPAATELCNGIDDDCDGLIESQPSQPTLACYETATFNTTTCSWNVTGTPVLANAGGDATECGGSSSVYNLIYQNATGSGGTASWSSTGNGWFQYLTGSGPYTDLSPLYHVGSTDLSSGSVTLTLTVTGANGCVATSSFVLTLVAPPVAVIDPSVVNPWDELHVCAGGSYDFSNAVVSPGADIYWNGGDGSFNSDNIQNPIYTPGPQDISNGNVYIHLNVMSFDGTTLCDNMVDINLVIDPAPAMPTLACYETASFNPATCSWTVTGTQPAQPTLACYQSATFNTSTCSWDVTGTPVLANAGGAASTCGGSYSLYNLLYQNATGSGGTASWSSTGNGWFQYLTGSGPYTDLSPLYHVGSTDLSSGSVTLTLTVTGANGCVATSSFVLTLVAPPVAVIDPSVVNPWDELHVCAGGSYDFSNAVVSPGADIYWNGGDGSFNSDNIQNPIYTPGPQDISNGNVYIHLNVMSFDGTTLCDNMVDINLVIDPAPAMPTLACYETASFNPASCVWDVTATGGSTTYYADLDGDGFGDASTSIQGYTCLGAPAGYVTDAADCNDSNAAVHPGATEVCNGIDDNCSGVADEGLTFTDYYADLDLDGYGAGAATNACAQPIGFVTTNTDCDDNNASANPAATEICNEVDDNCDGQIDEGVQNTYYEDMDGDGYGSMSFWSIQACSAPFGFVSTNNDCADNNPAINPGAAEVCNTIDDNCDGQINEGFGPLTVYYADADGDGYGNGTQAINLLLQGSSSASVSNGSLVIVGSNTFTGSSLTGSVSFVAPVDATYTFDWSYSTIDGPFYDPAYYINGTVYPLTDNNGPQTQSGTQSVTVTAGSTFGFSVVTTDDVAGSATLTINNFNGFTLPTFTQACSQPAGYAVVNGDCDDAVATTYPGATEICNTIDDNCNGQIDEGVQNTYYEDMDGDGYGSMSFWSIQACSAPFGFVSTNNDCADNNPAINPGAAEVCNTIDDNCDGQINEGFGPLTVYYADADGDGYGNGTQAINLLLQGSSSASVSNGSLVIVGSNSNTGSSLTGSVSFVAPVDGTYSFDWSFSTIDGAYFDPAYYINGTAYPLSDIYGSQSQSGTQSVTVTAGSTFGFSIVTVDDIAGSATLTVSNFNGFTLPTFTQACSQPLGYALVNGDCNDAVAAINPGATEVCNGIDDNCNGVAEEGLTFTNYYVDTDADGFGAGTAVNACAQPVGYVLTNTDCNNTNANIKPGIAELCTTAYDDNCNGLINEGCVTAGENPSNAISITTSIWPACTATTGTLVGASASTSAQTICLTGEDRWHQFVATSEGVSIVVNSTTANIVIELQTAAGVLVAQENAVSGLGGEILNHYGLTAGQVYKVGVRNYNSAQGTGTYSICAKMLKRGGCDYGPGPYTLCQYFKATWAGATGTNYTYTFTGVSGPASGNVYTRTQNSDICVLSNVLPTLPYGSTYNVLITNIYTINDGAGVAENISVPALSPCTMSTTAQPVTVLRTTDQCAAGPRFRGAVVAALPWVCGSTNWRWEFTELNAAGQPVGLPITVNRGAASNYITLSTIAQLQYGKTYNVRTAPILSYTGTNYQWGTTACMSIVGTAGMIAEGGSESESSTKVEIANEVNMSLYPNPTHGTDVNINLSGVTSENVQIRVVDAMGRQVWSNRYSADGILNTNITFERPLANGLYFVEAIYNGELQTQRMMVQK